ncbi:MAG TPA: bifunctional 3,4-dihydroxy-2-butanone-4-phosphate synthase/GTP cyclohydrolase II [bacterium]|nr:bifunctional 3,4-dihydroxy-2-butanone-4-phosphate synthase/GTP cyclohydrolase II [bacterium]
MNDKIFSSVEEAVQDIREGRPVIVVDDENRENEGDIVVASEKITPQLINFMAKEARGLICVALLPERIKELNLPPMVDENTALHETDFTVSVDAAYGVTTGISAYDRAFTIKLLIDRNSKPSDFAKPGHVFPIKAKEGGVLVRAGHTEASVDLARIAGLYPSGVICEIMKEDGTMARLPDLIEFAKKHNLKIVTIKDLIEYRRKREKLVKRVVETFLPTEFGDFKLILYRDKIENNYHIALVKGDLKLKDEKDSILVRVHSQCITGDIFHSKRCDCGKQLHKALEMIEKEGRGVLVYLPQEGRGIGLANKIMAYKIQDEEKLDTVDANLKLGFPPDLRDYGIGAQILTDLGLTRIRILTNNPKKIVGLAGYGIEVVERVSIEIEPNTYTEKYLKAKKEKLGHLIKMEGEDE